MPPDTVETVPIIQPNTLSPNLSVSNRLASYSTTLFFFEKSPKTPKRYHIINTKHLISNQIVLKNMSVFYTSLLPKISKPQKGML